MTAELPITNDYALAVTMLPPIHKDPFDRMLVAQALAETLPLSPAGTSLADYPADVRVV